MTEFVGIVERFLGVVNYSKTEKEHLEHIKEVFKRIQKANLKVNTEKCEFAQTAIEYLGYEINAKGIRPAEKAVENVLRFKVPESKEEVERFLGVVNWLSEFIPGSAEILRPITELKKTTAPSGNSV